MVIEIWGECFDDSWTRIGVIFDLHDFPCAMARNSDEKLQSKAKTDIFGYYFGCLLTENVRSVVLMSLR